MSTTWTAPSGTTWTKTPGQAFPDNGINDRWHLPEGAMTNGFPGPDFLSTGSESLPENWCARACDSNPNCSEFSIGDNKCYIRTTSGGGMAARTGFTAFKRRTDSPAIPDGVTTGYRTKPIMDYARGTAGGHVCNGDGWDVDGMQLTNWGAGQRYCIERFPRKQRAPVELGEFSKSSWYDVMFNTDSNSGFADGTNDQTRVGLRFTYKSIPEDILFNSGKMQGYFDTTTTNRAITDWCSSTSRQPTDLNNHKTACINAFGNGGSDIYDQKLLNACKLVSDWTNNSVCRDAVVNIIRNPAQGSSGTKSDAQLMARTYCNQGDTTTTAGSNRNKAICGCINVYDLGYTNKGTRQSNCFTTGFRDLPGCTDIVSKMGKFSALIEDPIAGTTIQTAFTDNGKLTQSCFDAQGAASTDTSILPYKSGAEFGQGTVIMNVCTLISQQGLAQNSPVNQACNQSATVNQYDSTVVPPGSPGGAPPTTRATPGTPTEPSPSPSPSSDDNTVVYVGGGAFVCCICLMLILAMVFAFT